MITSVEKHFDKVSDSYDSGKEKYSYYYDNLKSLLKHLIGEHKNVFEFGCGTGDLLVSLNPKNGIGYDLSSQMIEKCKFKYKSKKNLKFSTKIPNSNSLFISKASPTKLVNHKSLDAVFMSDVIEHLTNPVSEFKKVARIMNKNSKFIITMANPLWEPLLMIWERMGLKMKEGPHKRIRYKEIKILSEKLRMKIIKHDYKLLIPIKIPFVTKFMNKYMEKYFKSLCFIEYFVFVKI